MEIVEIDWLECKIFNPVTKEIIIDFCFFDLKAKSLIAAWFSDNIEDPVINNKTIEGAWMDFYNDFKKGNEDIPLFDFLFEGFLEKYDNPDWKVIRHNGSWLAHSPQGATVWYVVEKDIVLEEVDLTEFGYQE
jgi:hypothetical protein